MKINSFLKLKHVAWASGVLVAAHPGLHRGAHSGAKPRRRRPRCPSWRSQPWSRKTFPSTANGSELSAGQVNADVKAQVTGYLLTRNYKEGSYVRKGQLLFEIDPRPFQAALDQARGS